MRFSALHDSHRPLGITLDHFKPDASSRRAEVRLHVREDAVCARRIIGVTPEQQHTSRCRCHPNRATQTRQRIASAVLVQVRDSNDGYIIRVGHMRERCKCMPYRLVAPRIHTARQERHQRVDDHKPNSKLGNQLSQPLCSTGQRDQARVAQQVHPRDIGGGRVQPRANGMFQGIFCRKQKRPTRTSESPRDSRAMRLMVKRDFPKPGVPASTVRPPRGTRFGQSHST